MNIKTLFAIAFLSFGLTAAADNQIVSLAYEVNLSRFHAPA